VSINWYGAVIIHSYVLGLDVMPRSRSMSMVSRLLPAHEARIDAPVNLEDPVRQRGLAVIDVRDDADGADFGGIDGR